MGIISKEKCVSNFSDDLTTYEDEIYIYINDREDYFENDNDV